MYTLIAYKTESYDSRRGYVVEDYPSDFFYKNYLQKDEMIEHFKFYLNKKLGYSEIGYDMVLLFNGKEVIKKEFGKDYEMAIRKDLKKIALNILSDLTSLSHT